MTGRYTLSQVADRDLLTQATFFESHHAAMRFLRELHELFALLADHPGIGKPAEHTGSRVRTLSTGRHVVYYREQVSGIRILRVLHGSRDAVVELRRASRRLRPR